ncbi:hypothetical protein Egran_02382, partial [Elaphomyces granulatus]
KKLPQEQKRWPRAQNLALYALAKYLTGRLGAYPHYPLVNTKPNSMPKEYFAQPFTVADNGQVLLNMTYQDVPALANATMVQITQFTPDSEYPSSYLTDWNYWANPGGQLSVVANAVACPSTFKIMTDGSRTVSLKS